MREQLGVSRKKAGAWDPGPPGELRHNGASEYYPFCRSALAEKALFSRPPGPLSRTGTGTSDTQERRPTAEKS